jgi:hypothetical protein
MVMMIESARTRRVLERQKLTAARALTAPPPKDVERAVDRLARRRAKVHAKFIQILERGLARADAAEREHLAKIHAAGVKARRAEHSEAEE